MVVRSQIPTVIERQSVPTPIKIHVRTPTSRQRPTPTNPFTRSHTAKNLSPPRRNQGPTSPRSSPPRPSPPRPRQSKSLLARDIRESRDPPPALDASDDEEPVCEYDTSATVLYELLESSNWEKARSRCRSHPEEVRTWIVRKDRSLQVRWKLLPLHAAIIFQSPNFVVSTLLEKYPAAATRRDDQGMLPLHLAFRHKQEDEDLLELLLVHYPKAVLLKDKRDRVPLEHGRDSKFSARMMRLYADATVAGSRATSTTGATKDGLTGPTYVDSPLTTALESEHENKMAEIKAEYKERIAKLKEQHENLLNATKEEAKMALRQAKLDAEEDRKQQLDQHNEEMAELRDLLTKQVDKDKVLADALESEIAHLEVALQEANNERDRTQKKLDHMISHVQQMESSLSQITDDHDNLQRMVAQQQQSISASQRIRNDIIQQLLKQEDNDSGNERQQCTQMLELSDRIRRRIDRTLEHRQRDETTAKDDGPGRLERERGDAQDPSPQDIYYLGEKRNEGTGHFGTRDSNEQYASRTAVNDQFVQRTPGTDAFVSRDAVNEHYVARQEEGYGHFSKPVGVSHGAGDARVSGDEISAITDNSEF